MYLTKKVFIKGERRAILQGMRHAAPRVVYELLNTELQEAHKRGDLIFAEAPINDWETVPPRTRNERQIRKFYKLLFKFVNENNPEAYGDALQSNMIQYPKETIRADITLSELTRELDRSGFRCGILLILFRVIPRSILLKGMRKRKESGYFKLHEHEQELTLSRRMSQYLIRKMPTVVVDYRNKRAFSIMKEKWGEHNIFVHYGEAHIPGLTVLFEQNGWMVQESTQLDLTRYY